MQEGVAGVTGERFVPEARNQTRQPDERGCDHGATPRTGSHPDQQGEAGRVDQNAERQEIAVARNKAGDLAAAAVTDGGGLGANPQPRDDKEGVAGGEP